METATKTAAETRITATELARSLSDVLNRVQDRSERFVIEHNGRPVATLAPVELKRSITLGELFELLDRLPRPGTDWADAVEEVRRHQGAAEFPEWP